MKYPVYNKIGYLTCSTIYFLHGPPAAFRLTTASEWMQTVGPYKNESLTHTINLNYYVVDTDADNICKNKQ